jgi:hypothetical protein
MFMPGSTGTNKVLGQQSTSIETDHLAGNWIPGTGIVNSDSSTTWGGDTPNYWENQVSGGNHLRVYNMEAADAVTSSPTHFAPDGTNEYLGPAGSGYGGDPFEIITERNWAISVWLRLPNAAPGNTEYGIWSIGKDLTYYNLSLQSTGSDDYTDQFGTATYYRLIFAPTGVAGTERYVTLPDNLYYSSSTAESLWFNITVVATGTQRAPGTYYPSHATHQAILINGTVVDWWDGSFSGGSSEDLYVGAAARGSMGSLNSFWEGQIGHVHVYQPTTSDANDLPCLTVSKARQNYHAINETYKSTANHRHYGETSYGKFF